MVRHNRPIFWETVRKGGRFCWRRLLHLVLRKEDLTMRNFACVEDSYELAEQISAVLQEMSPNKNCSKFWNKDVTVSCMCWEPTDPAIAMYSVVMPSLLGRNAWSSATLLLFTTIFTLERSEYPECNFFWSKFVINIGKPTVCSNNLRFTTAISLAVMAVARQKWPAVSSSRATCDEWRNCKNQDFR